MNNFYNSHKIKNKLHERLLKSSIAVSIASLWVALDYLTIQFLGSVKVNEFLYAIYLLAGFRLVAVVVFGWTGVLGIFLGYSISGFFLRHFEPQDAISLGLLSSVAPLIAYRIWQKVFKHSNEFLNVSFIELFYLILLSGLINAFFRSAYLLALNKVLNADILLATFTANISGSIIFLFGLKLISNLFKRMSIRR